MGSRLLTGRSRRGDSVQSEASTRLPRAAPGDEVPLAVGGEQPGRFNVAVALLPRRADVGQPQHRAVGESLLHCGPDRLRRPRRQHDDPGGEFLGSRRGGAGHRGRDLLGRRTDRAGIEGGGVGDGERGDQRHGLFGGETDRWESHRPVDRPAATPPGRGAHRDTRLHQRLEIALHRACAHLEPRGKRGDRQRSRRRRAQLFHQGVEPRSAVHGADATVTRRPGSPAPAAVRVR